MKKLLLLILIVLFFSCEKKNDPCWRCEMIKVVSSVLQSDYSRTVNIVDTCNITQMEIDDIEKKFTHSKSYNYWSVINGVNTGRMIEEKNYCECLKQ